MTRRRIDDDQRATVVTRIKEGKGRNQISRETGLSGGTVSNIARQAGLRIVPAGVTGQHLKQLLAAAEAFHHERRLVLYDRAVKRAELMLEDPDLTPKELQHVMTVLAIAQDKYRVEMAEDKVLPQGRDTVIVYCPSNGRAVWPPPQAPEIIDVQARPALPAGSEEEG